MGGVEVSMAHLLRELYTLLTGQNLALVGLRAQASWTETAHESSQDSTESHHRWWPREPSRVEQFVQWRDARPTAEKLVEIATDGAPLLLVACEGPSGTDKARATLATLEAKLPK